MMKTKSMVENAWAEDMGQFLYNLDSDTRKITRSLKKIKLINKDCSIVFNKTCLNNNLLPKYTLFNIYIYTHTNIYNRKLRLLIVEERPSCYTVYKSSAILET